MSCLSEIYPECGMVCVSGGKKFFFLGNFGVLCVLQTPVLRFARLPYYRRLLFHNTSDPLQEVLTELLSALT